MTEPGPELPGKVTIYQVAKAAGVSITTVSHALNRPDKVSERTRARVLDVVDQMNFVPSAAAVSQARKGLGRIAVLAPFTSYASYLARLRGMMGVCDGQVDLVVFDQPSVAASRAPLMRSLPASGRFDGIVIMGLPIDDAMAESLHRRGLPVVLVDSTHPTLSSVNIDDAAGGLALGRHLLANGCRSFAFVSEVQASADYLSPGQRRIQGLVSALEEGGLDPGSAHWVMTGNNLNGGREAVRKIASIGDTPDAVLAHHDDLAAGVLLGLRDRGIRVPDDVQVTGYDDGDLAEALDLTTVRQPMVETGEAAASMMLGLLSGSDRPVHTIAITPQLVIRASTQPEKGANHAP
ncbi:MAG: LacI family DNA-binding transcriptional regulator [Aeromicrobium sp.]